MIGATSFSNVTPSAARCEAAAVKRGGDEQRAECHGKMPISM